MSQLKYNIAANLLGKVWTAAVSLAFIPLYIKFLGMESYGLIGFYTTLQVLFFLVDMGLSTTLNRELARLSVQDNAAQEMRDLTRTLEVLYWAFAGGILLVVLLVAPLIAHHWIIARHLSPAAVQGVLQMMGLAMALQFPFTLYQGGLLGLQRQLLLNGIVIVTATLRGVGAALILWRISPTVHAFFTWQVVTYALQTAAGAWFLWRCLPAHAQVPRFRKAQLLGIWRFAAGMAGISILAAILMQLDKIVLSKILPLEMFGYYSLASLIATNLYVIVNPIFTAAFPRFSQLVALHEETELTRLYHRTCQIMSVVLLPVAIVLALFSREVLLVWTGNRVTMENTHLLVTLLIIGYALNGLMNLPYAMQLAHGWTKLVLTTNIVLVVVLTPLIVFMAQHYGAVGAALVWVLLNSGYVFVTLQIMHRYLLKGEKWRWYLEDTGRPLLAALVVAGLCRWATHADPSRPAMLLTLVAVGGATLVASALAAPLVRRWAFDRLSLLRVQTAQ